MAGWDVNEIADEDLAELHQFLGLQPEAPAAAAAPAVGAASLSVPPGFEDYPSRDQGGGIAGGSAGRPNLGGLVGEASAKIVVVPPTEDPTASYLAATSWDDLRLSEEIRRAIADMGFVRPSKIQEWALPIAQGGGNMIGQAQNGSGKTAAFALSMLFLVDLNYDCPQAVCVSPTRELATQNYEVTKQLGRFTQTKYWLALPQTDRPPREGVKAQIIVGTPGKLRDNMSKRVIDPKWCKLFVVDEADMMIDEQNQMGGQVSTIKGLMPDDVQILLFSATWPERVEQFAKSMVPRAHCIKVEKEDLTLSTITQTYIKCNDQAQKKDMLSLLYAAMNVGQSIIFVNTRWFAFNLAKSMKQEGHAVSLICGTQTTGDERVDPAYRDRVMHEFRSGMTKVLISTDVLARGIDVPAVTMVVNYEMSTGSNRRLDLETYMHRIGRTGRFGLKGMAVNLLTADEEWTLDEIKKEYKCSITALDTSDLEVLEKQVRDLR